MITRIAKKEILEMWRDGRFRWTALIVVVLLGMALILGGKHYVTTKKEREAAQNLSRTSWLTQGSRNPHSAAHFGVYAFKPPQPLSLVDKGLDGFTGVSIWVEAHNQNPPQYRPAEDATSVGRFGELTGAFVLQLLLPLLIILLSYNSFAGERESGTLVQLLSTGAPTRKLATGKILGIVCCLAVLLVPASILGAVGLLLASENGWFVWSIPRLLLMSVTYLLYFGALVGVGLTVSALAKSSRKALIVLLVFWTVNCLLVPRLVSDLAEARYPSPTTEEFWEAVHKDINQGIDGHDPSNARSAKLKQQILERYGVKDEKDLPINLNGTMLNAGEEYGNTVFDKHYGEVWHSRFAQEKVHNVSGAIAPFMAVRSLSSAMAGTDLLQYRHFTTAVEQYRRDLNKFLNQYFAEHSRTSEGYNYFAGKELWDQTPGFTYEPPGTAWVLKQQLLPLTVLLLWCFGALSLSVLVANQTRKLN
ncbi:MAG TPA: DUF3526 domain-containing protein [Pyrinomonadaceae bacterium]|nr:DUF3526 domain-containing protein [Pyrinomonadaceae bacterium]